MKQDLHAGLKKHGNDSVDDRIRVTGGNLIHLSRKLVRDKGMCEPLQPLSLFTVSEYNSVLSGNLFSVSENGNRDGILFSGKSGTLGWEE